MPRRARSASTIRYALDDEHRLLIQERDRATGVLRSIRMVEGTLTIDRRNRLVYEAAVARSTGGGPDPRTIVLDGTWSLTPDHQLALTLRETDASERHTLTLNSAVTDASANTLMVSLRRSGRERIAQQLALSGRWQADAHNRLTFLVAKADGDEDRLTLEGGWEVGRQHELRYRYQQHGLGRAREEKTISFDGSWDITRANRLMYRVSGSDDSTFEFRASLQRPSLLARDGRIVYQVGVGIAGRRRRWQQVTLFGTWKLNRDLSVSFEVPYAGGRVQAIRFEGQARLSARDRIAVALQSSERRPLGLTITFTRDLAPDASMFLQLRRDVEERAAVAGVRVRW